MLWLHRAWLGFLGLVCVLLPPNLASEKFRYASQIGIAESRADGSFCLTIEDAAGLPRRIDLYSARFLASDEPHPLLEFSIQPSR